MQKPDQADLMRAYTEHVERYGRASAVEMVKNVSGSIFIDEMPEDKIAAAVAALAKPQSPIRVVAKAGQSMSVAEKLNAMAATIYRS